MLCGLLSAYLASIGKKSNYIFGLINYLLMGYVAFHNNLYGMAAFYVLACAPLQIHGLINWNKNTNDESVKRRKFTFKTSVIVIVSCAASSLVVGYLLSLIPTQQLSFLDAASNCVNLCGIILMNLRYMESWWIWLVNNLLDLIIWTIILMSGGGSNAVMMFITAIAYFVINIYGICEWMKNSKIEKHTTVA